MSLSGLIYDLRFAARSLTRRKSFTAITVLTLALGIGATTAVFTLVDGVLLRPLPYEAAGDLVSVRHLGREGRDQLPMSTGLYLLYRERAETLEDIALYGQTVVNLVVDGSPERVAAQAVTPGFFGVLREQAVEGRTFTEEEGEPQGPLVVILSDGFWRERYGGDPAAIGQEMDVNGRPRRIIGVMPPGFGFPDEDARLWFPIVVDPAQAPLANFGLNGIARIAEGRTLEAVRSEISALIDRLAEIYPDSGSPAFLKEVGLRASLSPMKDALVGDIRPTLWILFGTVALVLLIACANVANLLLVRAEGRSRELALRQALGAGRAQIFRWYMAESLLLAFAGGVLGLVIAAVAVRASLGVVPTDIPRIGEVRLDLGVVGFTALISLACALFFGVFPLLRRQRSGVADHLRDSSGRTATGGRQRNRLRSGLVVAQMALALMLLVGAGLMLRSFQALRSVDPGIQVDHVLTAQIIVPTAEIQGWQETATFFRELKDRMAAQPGVESVGLIDSLPLDGGTAYYSIEVEDEPRGPDELPVFANNVLTAPGYFESMGMRLLEGRTLQPGDGAEGNRVLVISRAFADHFWPDRSPLGRRMRLGFGGEDWYEIVGVVDDVHFEGLDSPVEEAAYWPITVGPAESPQVARGLFVTVRTSADPLAFVSLLRQQVADLNSRIPVSNPRTMEDLFDTATARTSFTMALLIVAAGIALLLGLVGIYGVISYVVSQRTREIGVRMALGATGPTVRGMVLRQGLFLALLGVAVGLVASAALSTVMASILYGVRAIDPLTYGVVAISQVTVALLASWIPARRAAGMDPSLALRME